MQAVQQDGVALYSASAEFKGDPEIVLAAVAQNADALKYASDELRNGGLKSNVWRLIGDVFNVSKPAFIATILFGAKAAPTVATTSDVKTKDCKLKCFLRLLQPSVVLPGPLSTQIKKRIWGFAGVRSGERWEDISSAARNLGCSINTIDKGKRPRP